MGCVLTMASDRGVTWKVSVLVASLAVCVRVVCMAFVRVMIVMCLLWWVRLRSVGTAWLYSVVKSLFFGGVAWVSLLVLTGFRLGRRVQVVFLYVLKLRLYRCGLRLMLVFGYSVVVARW